MRGEGLIATAFIAVGAHCRTVTQSFTSRYVRVRTDTLANHRPLGNSITLFVRIIPFMSRFIPSFMK